MGGFLSTAHTSEMKHSPGKHMHNHAALSTLNHEALLALLRDTTNTIELRRDVIVLLQDRGHRPLDAAIPNEHVEFLLSVAPMRERPRSWLRRIFR